MTRDPQALPGRSTATCAVSFILHGGDGPRPEVRHDVRATIAATLPDAEVLDTSGHGGPLAQAINEAARSAGGDRLVIGDGSVPIDPDALRTMAGTPSGTLTIGVAGTPSLYPESELTDADRRTLAALADACGTGSAAARAPWFATSPLWAVSRALFLELGGLDDRLVRVGLEADLAVRARRAGAPVAHVPLAGQPTRPHDDAAYRFLSLRNRLASAWKSEPVEVLAPHLAELAAAAILVAWRSADISTSAFAFAPASSADAGSGRPPTALADESGTALPLLAIDAFLTLAAELAAERDRWVRPFEPEERNPLAGPPERSTRETEGSRAGTTSGQEPSAGGPGGQTAHRLPTVSVIVVNWNGEAFLRDCFTSLVESDYPKDLVELICVDNGSHDGSRALLAAEFPGVRVEALTKNRGFTGGNNAGVRVSTGDVLVFLNNDMRLAADALGKLVAAIDDEHPSAAARVMSWDGKRLDFIGGSMSFEGRGYQEHFGRPPAPHRLAQPETFFPNGGAFAITRDAYTRCGGFDEAFFAYYDDVDLGWRLRQIDAPVRLAVDAVAWHRHGGTSGRHPQGKKRFLMERNALWTVMKNYDAGLLAPALAAALLLAVRRITQDLSIRPGSALARRLAPYSARCRPNRLAALIRPGPGAPAVAAGRDAPEGGRTLRRIGLESFAALGSAVADAGGVLAERARVQARRTVPDRVALAGAGRLFDYASSHASYRPIHDTVVDVMELPRRMRPRTRILIVTHEPLQARMSGPGVRALEMARALGSTASATVATPYPPEVSPGACTVAQYAFDSPETLRALAEQADVLLVQGFTLARFPFIEQGHWPIVVDLYCPFTLEHLEMTRGRAEASEAAGVLRVQNDQLRLGDFFLAASERQRDFWIGALHTAGRINPLTYARDPTLRSLIDVVPFGLPATPPDAGTAEPGADLTTRVMKGVVPGIGPADRVVLWGGSMLDWQDPQVLIRAVAALSRRRDDVKLFFVGTRHPNPQVPPMKVVEESIALARELGVLDTHVFFNDWVPYESRGRYLREADIGVSTHRDHLETRFAYRTRMLDYLWAGLPIVCTSGDHFADEVAREGAGLVVPPANEIALADAIDRLLSDDTLYRTSAAGATRLAADLRWDVVIEPLRRFCLAPEVAADRAPGVEALRSRLEKSYRLTRWFKRVALGLGLRERTIEDVKQWRLTQRVMSARNAVALHRARRAARD